MSKHRWLANGFALVALATGLAFAGAASADPAKIAPADENGAFRAFGKFASSWMADMKQREDQNRRQPTIQYSGNRAFATYTGYAPEWNVEVEATGDRGSPYVGILHYQEQVYTCRDETTSQCQVSRSTPVTEVFPYRDGSWKY